MSQQADSSVVSVLPEQALPAPAAAPASQTCPRGLPWFSTWLILVSLSALAASLLVVASGAAHGFFVPVLAVLICLLAAHFDAFTTRIPNHLTYPAILLGLTINLIAAGLAWLPAHSAIIWLAAPGLTQSLLAVGVCLPLALIGLLFGVGGGDLKLMLAIGALLGLSQLGYILIVSLTAAAVYALINLLIAGRLNRVLRSAALHGLELFFLRRFPADDAAEHLPGSRVPMAVPLAIGLIVAQIISVESIFGVGL